MSDVLNTMRNRRKSLQQLPRLNTTIPIAVRQTTTTTTNETKPNNDGYANHTWSSERRQRATITARSGRFIDGNNTTNSQNELINRNRLISHQMNIIAKSKIFEQDPFPGMRRNRTRLKSTRLQKYIDAGRTNYIDPICIKEYDEEKVHSMELTLRPRITPNHLVNHLIERGKGRPIIHYSNTAARRRGKSYNVLAPERWAKARDLIDLPADFKQDIADYMLTAFQRLQRAEHQRYGSCLDRLRAVQFGPSQFHINLMSRAHTVPGSF